MPGPSQVKYELACQRPDNRKFETPSSTGIGTLEMRLFRSLNPQNQPSGMQHAMC